MSSNYRLLETEFGNVLIRLCVVLASAFFGPIVSSALRTILILHQSPQFIDGSVILVDLYIAALFSPTTEGLLVLLLGLSGLYVLYRRLPVYFGLSFVIGFALLDNLVMNAWTAPYVKP